MNIKTFTTSQKGIALPWALFALALVVIAGGIYTKSIHNEIILNTSNVQRTQARYAAESGIHEIIYNYPDEVDVTGALQNASYTASIDSGVISSTGQSYNKMVKMESIINEDGMVTSFKVVYEE